MGTKDGFDTKLLEQPADLRDALRTGKLIPVSGLEDDDLLDVAKRLMGKALARRFIKVMDRVEDTEASEATEQEMIDTMTSTWRDYTTAQFDTVEGELCKRGFDQWLEAHGTELDEAGHALELQLLEMPVSKGDEL
jgi:hypothetical protein